MVMLKNRSGWPNPSGLGFCFYLSLRGANATKQSPPYIFTTKSLPLNLKMSIRTQTCDANVIPPAISIQNHYHKTQKWENSTISMPNTCHCKKRRRLCNLRQIHAPYLSLRGASATKQSPPTTPKKYFQNTIQTHFQFTSPPCRTSSYAEFHPARTRRLYPGSQTCLCEKRTRPCNLHRPDPKKKRKRKANPFYNWNNHMRDIYINDIGRFCKLLISRMGFELLLSPKDLPPYGHHCYKKQTLLFSENDHEKKRWNLKPCYGIHNHLCWLWMRGRRGRKTDGKHVRYIGNIGRYHLCGVC